MNQRLQPLIWTPSAIPPPEGQAHRSLYAVSSDDVEPTEEADDLVLKVPGKVTCQCAGEADRHCVPDLTCNPYL